ncbi:hypothetical protein LWI29_000849 [Acer saccharum]|uniref:Uncharacterized protein n=1 Tax=Acer saccharum TaxID=4024 RepID=A0AA39TKL4_ACESA|nr:hypothetical protein LWI29_000849 [Acer saccharum]
MDLAISSTMVDLRRRRRFRFHESVSSSIQSLYHLSLCFKLGFMAANLVILEDTEQQEPTFDNKHHIVDFEIGQGGQYMNLLNVLSGRQNGKPSVLKITAVAAVTSNGSGLVAVKRG